MHPKLQLTLTAVATALSLTHPAAHAQTAPAYHAIDLGPGQPGRFNSLGDLAGLNGDFAGFWRDNTWHRVADALAARAIDAQGRIVGARIASSDNFAEAATLFRADGHAIKVMPDDDRGNSVANDINDQGLVVGSWSSWDGPERAFAWQGGQRHALAAPAGGHSAAARAVNASGSIVGHATFTPSYASTAAAWHHNAWVPFPDVGTGWSSAEAINTFGHVAGWMAPQGNGPYIPFVYDGFATSVLPLPVDATGGWVEALNDQDVAVGQCQWHARSSACVFAGGGAWDLRDLVDNPADIAKYDLVSGTAVDNAGRVAVLAQGSNFAWHALLLVPVAGR